MNTVDPGPDLMPPMTPVQNVLPEPRRIGFDWCSLIIGAAAGGFAWWLELSLWQTELFVCVPVILFLLVTHRMRSLSGRARNRAAGPRRR